LLRALTKSASRIGLERPALAITFTVLDGILLVITVPLAFLIRDTAHEQ